MKPRANRPKPESDGVDQGDDVDLHRIRCHLEQLLEDRSMTLNELADRVGVSRANLSSLKNNRARAVRFSTLTRICEVLGCDVGDLLSVDRLSDAHQVWTAGL